MKKKDSTLPDLSGLLAPPQRYPQSDSATMCALVLPQTMRAQGNTRFRPISLKPTQLFPNASWENTTPWGKNSTKRGLTVKLSYDDVACWGHQSSGERASKKLSGTGGPDGRQLLPYCRISTMARITLSKVQLKRCNRGKETLSNECPKKKTWVVSCNCVKQLSITNRKR